MTDEELNQKIQDAVEAATTKLTEAHNAAVKGLKDKNTELLSKNQSLKDAADQLEDAKANASNDVETIKSLNQSALEKVNKKLEEALARESKLIVDNAIAADLTANNVAKPYMGTLTKALKADAEVKDGVATINGQPISDYIKDFLSGDDGKHYVSAPANSGAGATGSSNVTTTPDKWNLTEYTKMKARDPAQATAYAKAHNQPFAS